VKVTLDVELDTVDQQIVLSYLRWKYAQQ